ncbi:peptide deformylase [Deinococcus sp. KNUC1210]|uniref:peptide deformylase n=1 Tax=Deinococcus sp. KNUC1210 TaxID=2917691 RepID=UPI001EEFCCD6|nr:peptide deformylase [Deinococcus sp. KNUC1210]ULH16387.1 peptide deformylase [Deinococcus sp. KNUC1210]
MSEFTASKPSVYPIRLYGDPVLRRKARAITDVTAPVQIAHYRAAPLKEVADIMLETMFEARGVGLAAPQIGLSARMFVAVEYEDDEDEGKETPLKSRVLQEYVMINPVIRPLDRRKDGSFQEGCLSIPGIYEEGVKRNRTVRVDYTDLDGNPRTLEAEDYLARVFQHETDHLDGVFFLDRLPPEITEEYRKELLSMQRQSREYLKELELLRKAPGHVQEKL